MRLDGKHNAEGPAPDGEEYFAMALFMASARWGEGEGIFAYAAQAREILRHCVHQPEIVPGGRTMWDAGNHMIRFVPEADFTDPSYHLPHFYTLFAERANPEDRAFWLEAAKASRESIVKSAHPVTGMSPEYAEYDGTPRLLFGKPFTYYSDAYRVVMNIALDTLWFGRNEGMARIATNLQDVFMAFLKAITAPIRSTERPRMNRLCIPSPLPPCWGPLLSQAAAPLRTNTSAPSGRRPCARANAGITTTACTFSAC